MAQWGISVMKLKSTTPDEDFNQGLTKIRASDQAYFLQERFWPGILDQEYICSSSGPNKYSGVLARKIRKRPEGAHFLKALVGKR